MRAISAIDAALWDILGQSLGAPIYQLLGGLAQDRIRTYNTCGGPLYGRRGFPRAGEGKGPLEDLWAQINEPEVLAEELLAEGITAMKIWPFDRFALRGDGRSISDADLRGRPRAVPADPRGGRRPDRDHARGPRLLGHHDGQADRRRGRGVPPGLARGHGPRPRHRRRSPSSRPSTSTPIIASEMLITRYQYRPLLERRAADIVMVDPTWAGGITESRKIVTLAESFGLPVALHDCTGPFTLLAGIHLALSAPNAIYQEHVRAYVRGWFTELVAESVEVVDGHILPPTGAGIGTKLLAGRPRAPRRDRPDHAARGG